MGVVCLRDFVHILKFENNYKLEGARLMKKFKAYFYIGMIYWNMKQYE